jgi:hypothetical protein
MRAGGLKYEFRRLQYCKLWIFADKPKLNRIIPSYKQRVVPKRTQSLKCKEIFRSPKLRGRAWRQWMNQTG